MDTGLFLPTAFGRLPKVFGLFLICALPSVTFAEIEKFKIYGFMDYEISTLSLENNNTLRAFLREDIGFQMGGLNVYFDYFPNAYSRALIETSYRPNDRAATAGGPSEPFYVERAWIEGIYSDWLKIRAGKFITPAGVWNVDHGSPIITSISAPVQTTWFPVFPARQLGIMTHGTLFVGDHDLVYNFYGSTGPAHDNRLRNIEDIAWGGHLELKMDALDQLEFGISGLTGMRRKDELVVIQYQMDGAASVESQDQWFFNDDTLNHREIITGAQFKAKYLGIGLQAEYNFRRIFNILDSWKETDYNAYYTLLSYDFRFSQNLGLTPYFLFETITWDDPENTTGSNILFDPEIVPLDGWTTFSLGLNFSIRANMRVKFEYGYSRLHKTPTSLFGGTVNYNQYQKGDLDLQGFTTQFTMAF